MAIVFIEFKKRWLEVDDYEELFAEAVFDKNYLRKIIYHDIITPMPKFAEYINSGRFIKDFRRDKNYLEHEEGGLRLIAEEIKEPELMLEKVEQALKDAINYEYTDKETAKTLQNFRDILSKL